MKKLFRILGVALVALMISSLLAACGDNTATTAPATTAATTAAAQATTARPATTAAATTAAATTAATTATTAAATTAATTATTAAVATTAATSATTAAGAAGGTIVIYSSLPLTGSSEKQTRTLVQAMQLALEDATGGTGKIGNFTIKYESLDDATAAKGQWDAAQEAANANRAVADPDAMVYLGTFNSGAAQVSIPILNKAGMVMISPANTYPGLTRKAEGVTKPTEPDDYYKDNPSVRNYFRVATPDDVQGPAAAAFTASLNVKKIFVIDDSQAYGKGLADAYVASCADNGLDCSQRASINGKESDYKSLASDIKAKAPEAIFFGGITQQQAGKLVADIRAAGITVPFIGGDGINEQAFIDGAGAAANGVYATAAGIDDTKLPQKGQDFLKKYKAKYPNEAIDTYTIYGYEAMNVALDAIKRAGAKDRKAILAAVAATKDFDGVLGKWSFDKNGDISLVDFKVSQVKDGKYVYLTQTKPKAKV